MLNFPNILLPVIEQIFVNFSLIFFYILLFFFKFRLLVVIFCKKYFKIFMVLFCVLNLHFRYMMKHPQNPQWNTLFTVQIWLNGQLTWTMKQKDIGSEKVLVLVNIRTWVLKSRQFHEQIRSLGFRTCSEGLFTCSHVSGSIALLFGTGQSSFITSFNDWRDIGSHEMSRNHGSPIRIFVQGNFLGIIELISQYEPFFSWKFSQIRKFRLGKLPTYLKPFNLYFWWEKRFLVL